MNEHTLPRLAQHRVAEHLQVMPAVVLTGARQSGKSTLAHDLVPGDRVYYSLDDLDVAEVARRDPMALMTGPRPITIDEIQREPDLLLAVKRAIDEHRRPGQFLLTGSANLLLMRGVSESLAGRASYLTLWPMTRREQQGTGRCGIWDELISAESNDWIDVILSQPDEPADWRPLARRGGFPTPALHLESSTDRGIWFGGYIQTYLERDLRAISAIDALPDFRRLMRAACHRLGQLVNQTELGRDVGLPQPTVHRYLNLLETSYLVVRLPAYAVNRTKRLIKSPKLYWSDTGLAIHLSGGLEPAGAHLENLILHDMIVWRDTRSDNSELFYWRTAIGEEVDFVIEAGDRLLPIEIKASSRPRISDTRGLRVFRSEYGSKALPGLLLHTGSEVKWITQDVLALPWWRIL